MMPTKATFQNHGSRKNGQNEPKMSQIPKLAKNPPKSYKRTKLMCIPAFRGDVCVKKWALLPKMPFASRYDFEKLSGRFAKELALKVV